MSIKEILVAARARGVTFRVDGENLTLSAPKGALTPELRQAITSHKAELLAFFRSGDTVRTPIPRLAAAETEPGPLSASQARLWFLDRLVPNSALYNVHFEVHLSGALDEGALLASLVALTERHALLRATFPAVEGQPRLVVAPAAAWEMPVVDLRGSGPEKAAGLTRLAAEHAVEPFDLARGPLLRTTLVRLSDEAHVLVVTQHHIITDAWSIGVFLRELPALYAGFRKGEPAALPELPIRYVDYARWQQAELAGEEARQSEAWWKQSLAGLPRLDLPAPRTPARGPTHAGDACAFELSAELTAGLKELAARESCTLFVVLLAVWAAVLHRHCRQEDFGIGTVTAGRDRAELRDLVGCFVNTLVLRCDLSGDPDGATLLRRLSSVVEDALDHQDVPFDRIVSATGTPRSQDLNPLLRASLVLESAPLPDLQALGWAVKVQRDDGGVHGTAKFELGLTMTETRGRLAATLEYATDLFDAATIERITGHFQVLAAGLVADPGRPVSSLPLLTAAERQQVLVEWNRTESEIPRDRSIHELFEAQVERTPDAVAVVFEGQELSYRELDLRANRLAHHLRALGVSPDVLVGLCVQRSAEMVVGLLGILKAGGAYVPLDPAYPPERLAFMIDDAKLSVLVTEARLAALLPAPAARVVSVDADRAAIEARPATSLPPTATPEDLAYVIYTSGSTGKPKGVEIPHRAVVNFLHTMAARPGIVPEDRLLAVTSLSFDIAGLELFLPLVVGARVEIASRLLALDGTALRRRLERSGITVMQATPATFQLLLEAGWQGSRSFKVLVGGEAVPRELVTRLTARAGAVWNMYGPTETTIWSCIHPLAATDGPVLIGRPIANTSVYVLDQRLQPVPVGVPGELFLGGAGVARGYRARPELTSSRFIDDPFASGERLYRTGDLCRFQPDGTLEFLGRIDHQVKIRGFRIELGEIEATLSSHPAVQACVAATHEDGSGDKRLAAYVVRRDETPADELREHLKKTLPDYMVPSAFVFLEALPLTPNGKVDRKRLPAAPTVSREAARAPSAPSGELERTIQKIWQDVLGVESVGATANFFDIGGHSLLLARVGALLEKALEREIPIVDLLEHPTITSLARHLAPAPAQEAAAPVIAAPRRAPASSGAVAVIGMAGRFPGAANLDEFWRNLAGGVEGVSFLTDDELAAAGVPAPLWSSPGYVKAKGLLEQADWFDAAFFGYSPREATLLDPQQRVFLECAWEALEHAGHVPRADGPRIGVFAGASANGLWAPAAHADNLGQFLQAYYGASADFLATRVSYKLDLKGPAFTIQTACSTSLVAVHVACRSLLDGDCDMALAGGVSVTFPLAGGYPYQEGLILSPDGHCRAFDEKAQGTLFGNGVGIVLLKRLEDALSDGDVIHAVIRGSAINNDGSAKIGFTAPSVAGQTEVIGQALAAAGVGAETIGYVEAHGTGTPLGDPIEVTALTRAFRQSTERRGYCALGSVKSNVGHLDAAAGIAGLLKTVLSLKHRQIAPSLHFERPNPRLGLPESPFYVSSQLLEWPSSEGWLRRAGVSSFGIGGTNAHVVLEEAPVRGSLPVAPVRSAELFVLSARSEAALNAQAARLKEHLEAHPDLRLGEVAYSLATTRSAMEHRVAIAASDREALAAALLEVAEGRTPEGAWRGRSQGASRPRVFFVFPGQGSQWLGMGRQLMAEEPAFRAALEACDQAIEKEAGWSVLSELMAEEGSSQLGRIDVVQPVLFAVEVALAALWRSWGVEPDGVVGHSMGETAAAYVAGALSLDDAVKVICRRSLLLRRLSGQGEMAVVELPVGEAEAALRGYEDRLSVAVSNSPRSTVLSGDPGALSEVLSGLEAKGVFCRRVKVDVASHSPQVEPLRGELLAALSELTPGRASVPMRSTVTGQLVEGLELQASYWMANLREPVRFAAAVEALLGGESSVFVEMSPHPLLTTAVEEVGQATGQKGVAVASLRRSRPERRSLLEALGALWTEGHSLDVGRLFPAGGRRVPLPSYAWQRERYSVEAPASGVSVSPRRDQAGDHPLLGEELSLSTQAGTRLWETTLDLDRVPWLADHRLHGTMLFPGTAYLEMALVAGAATFGDAPFQITEVVLSQALAFADDAAVRVQTMTTEEQPGRLRFQVASLIPGAGRASWRIHARGVLERAERAEVPATLDLGALRDRLRADMPEMDHYAELTRMGFGYGPAFMGLVELWRGDGEALGRVRLPEAAGSAAPYRMHPALLDVCIQGLATIFWASGETSPWVPVEVGNLRVFERFEGELWCHVRSVSQGVPTPGRRRFDFHVVDSAGVAVAELSGLVVQRLPSSAPRREEDDWFLEVAWEPAAASAPALTASRWLLLGEGDGVGAALQAALQGAGHAVHHAAEPEASVAGIRRLLVEAFGGQPPTAVVHLGSLDGGQGLDARSVESALVHGCDSVLATVQALAAMGYRDAPRLWLVTRGAQAAGNSDVAAGQAPLLGLGRTIAVEHHELRCVRVDLDPARPQGEVSALLSELLADDAEDEVAWRDGERRVARLVRRPPEAARNDRSAAIQRDGSYLVTGGLGGLGLSVAGWLAEKGAGHLVLVGRSGAASAEQQAAVAALEARGTAVTVAQADVADPAQMARVMGEVMASGMPLRGVVHAAGTLEDGLLLQQTPARFRAVMGSKLLGALHLHTLTRELPLDFFVMYSSASGLFGSPGQGNYAAANTFLDGLAHHRKTQGLPALSIAWGMFAEVGLSAAQDNRGGRLASRGMRTLRPEDGLSALARLLEDDRPQVGFAPVDLRQWVELYPPMAASRMLSRLRATPDGAATKPAGDRELLLRLAAAAPAERALLTQESLRAQVSQVLRIPRNKLDVEAPLTSMGMDSLLGLELRNRVEALLGIRMPTTLLWTYPTIAALSAYLAKEVHPAAPVGPPRSPVVPAVLTAPAEGMSQERLKRLTRLEQERTEPIAVIGIGCRFPGGGTDPEAFWRALDAGVDSVSEVPPDRWGLDSEPGADPLRRAMRWGAFLDDVRDFDAGFFGISPREADHLDPQQRLLLEVAWEALEHAGVAPDRLMGSRTGLFIGITTADYLELCLPPQPEPPDLYMLTGNGHCFAAGRLAYSLGLQGPAFAVDTACSSSLVALHLACQALRNGEASMALAGGVNVMLSPVTMGLLASTQAMSPDGRCRTFDASANGFVRGEGCGVVVLKRLRDAQRDGDTILALIRGSAVNQDGRSTGLTAPNVLAQQAMLTQALESAGALPGDVGYVECHGTGTSLGDPIEVEALAEVLSQGRSKGALCMLGALKSNLGHLEAAAGIAGLIKVVLSLGHEAVPRNLHFKTLNPRIQLPEGSFLMPTQTVSWPRGEKKRLAGVSSFGLSGTNAHVVLEEAPVAPPRAAAPSRSAELFVLSAKSEAALDAAAGRLREHLDTHPEVDLGDVAFSLATTRSAMEHRLAVAASSRAALSEALSAAEHGRTTAGIVRGTAQSSTAKRAFLFTGQGAQRPGMGRGLYAEWPAFREAFDRCAGLFERELARPLREVMWAEPDSAEAALLDQTGYTQPALFTLEYALWALWRSWGVEPELVAGHSIGELVAACVAGVFSLEDGARLVAARGRLMQALPAGGAMVSIAASEAEVARAVAAHAEGVSIAAVNGPEQVVISGSEEPVRAIAEGFAARGVRTRALRVSHAFHSPLMEPMLEELGRVAESVVYRQPSLGLVSNRSGRLAGEEVSTAGYWVRQVREAVRFADSVQALHEAGAGTFIEVGPRSTLLSLVGESLPGAEPVLISSLGTGREEAASVLEALGGVWTRGGGMSWKGVFPAGGRRVPLPSYAWQRERHWVKAQAGGASVSSRREHAGGHPLLGEGRTLSTQAGTRLWETTLDLGRLPWLGDHRLQGMVVFPGAGYLEMALAAGDEAAFTSALAVTDAVFVEALTLTSDLSAEVQVVTTEESSGRLRFQIASRAASQRDRAWTVHARGTLRSVKHTEAPTNGDASVHLPAGLDLAGVRARCGQAVAVGSVYAALREHGFDYGPAFRGLVELWQGDGEALGKVRLPQEAGAAAAYRIHPALLDACLQVTTQAWHDADKATWMPVEVGSLRLLQRPPEEMWCHARVAPLGPEASGNRRSIDCKVVDAMGTAVAEVCGLVVQRVGSKARPTEQDDWFLELSWEPAAVPVPRVVAGRFLLLGEGGQVGTALRATLEAAGHTVVQAVAGPPEKVPAGCVAARDTSSAGVRAVLADAFRGQAPTAVVHLGSLDAGPSRDTALAAAALEATLAAGTDSALATVQALVGMGYRDAPRLWLVTCGAQAAGNRDVAVAQAPLVGLRRVVAMEHPALRCAQVDLDPARSDGEVQALFAELVGDGDEPEIALRGGERQVARLVHRWPESERGERIEPAGGRPLRLEIDKPGVLDDLVLRPVERRAPGPGEVEIAVEAAGLNFLDVLMAMGVMPNDMSGRSDGPMVLGGECAGRIAAVGEGVSELALGQSVIAMAPGAFASHVTTRATLVVPRPERLSATEAAALSLAYLTAWYALAKVAHLQRGERVLIHAATGGVGLAAVQWAQHVGAEVYATAGSAEKRAHLAELGVRYVSDSRSDAFVRDVLAWTGGEGVDVVLNSLSGELIEKSFGLLRSHGRFVELGKRDYYANNQLGLRSFLRNLSFSLVDLGAMGRERPGWVRALLLELFEQFASGALSPPPVETFPISRAAEAFRKMAQGRHIGKLVLTLDDPGASVHVAAPATTAIQRDGSYLVTGGLGGLGLSVAGWLADKGAGHLVLLGRSGAASAEQKAAVAALGERGTRVTVATADVADRAQLARVLGGVAASGMPLRGVIHAAGLLDDGVLLQQTPARFRDVMAPKILGALHLHELTRTLPLDFFVLYASTAGILGAPGQSNYAAANTFLDALAHQRKAQGLPALSIDWGAFSEVGLAAAQEQRGARLASRGLQSMTPGEGLAALERLLATDRTQVAVLPLNARQWVELYPAAASSRMLSRLLAEQRSASGRATRASQLAEQLARAEPVERTALLLELIRGETSQVLRLPEGRLKDDVPFTNLGMDSLMSLELRNRIESTLGIRVPPTLLWTYPTVSALSAHVSNEIRPAMLEEPPRSDAGVPASGPAFPVDLQGMSQDESERLIDEEFEALA